MLRPFLSVLFTLAFWTNGQALAEKMVADIVLHNGKVYTVDSARSIQQAIAVRGNTLVAVGSNEAVDKLIGPKTKIIDLHGRTVLPGLIDAHTHPVLGAINADKCSLSGVESKIDAIRPVVQECLKANPGGPNAWFEVVQLDNYGFEANKADIDSIEAKRPLILTGNDGHTVWANSQALKLAKITAATKDPDGGQITRDAKGEPTGALADNAMALVQKLVPSLTLDQKVEATAKALAEMNAQGITSLQDAYVTKDELAVWRKLYASKRLSMRVQMAQLVDDLYDDSDKAIAKIKQFRAANSVNADFLRADMVKLFADGVIETPTQTASLLEPYLDEQGKPTANRGKDYFNQKTLNSLVAKLDAVGFSIHVHAIGDRSTRGALDAFAFARQKNGSADRRHQIAHLELVDPSDFPRFKQLGVIANMQLMWAQRDSATGASLEPYLGPERHKYLYPAKGIKDAGGMIAGGSDWDVTPFNPFIGIEQGITRAEGRDKPPLYPEQSLTLSDMIDAYTINAAFALGQEKTTGSLEAGKRADLIVLDRDIFAIDPYELRETNVDLTLLDGKVVHDRAP